MTGVMVNGVFEGGGIRGLALAGAAAAALDHGYTFDHTVGTSAGAMVASLVSAGYTADELSSTVRAVDWPAMLDPVPGLGIPLLGRHIALVFHRGMYRGSRLERVWSELLAEKGIETFGDLRSGALSVVVTDISHARGISFPRALALYGYEPAEFSVARAVRMSAAVPFMFKPVPLWDRRMNEQVLMSDGATAANYPVGLARPDRPVLGFRLEVDQDEHPHETVKGPASLARSIVLAGVRARYTLPRVRESDAHVINVPVSMDLDFDISPDVARKAFDRGRDAAREQLDQLVIAPAA